MVLACFMGLSACETTPSPRPATPETTRFAYAVPEGSREYKVDTRTSLLQIFVYRGGAMARLGHNHVIASRHLAGSVYLAEDPLATRFDIAFPVSELTVDEPGLREAAGPDFAANVPDSAREGTRGNLLSAALLDGANHADIRLRASDVRAAADGYDVGVDVLFKGSNYPLRVPVTLTRDGDALIASGEFRLRQTELGLKPFSVAMGTLVVLDDMRVRFRITARP